MENTIPKFKVHQMNGTQLTVEGRAFTVCICNALHQFFVHASEGVGNADAVLAVSDVESGRRFAVVTLAQFQAALCNEVDAANLAVSAVIAKYGEQRVRSVLAGAPRI